MIQFQVEVEVPESRRVGLTFPPETPVGPNRFTVTAAGAEPGGVRYYRPDDAATAAEFDGFLRLVPLLRPTHGGTYVAVRGGRVIASGPHLDPVLKLAKAAAGGGPFYCGWVEPPEGYVLRFGSPTSVTETQAQ